RPPDRGHGGESSSLNLELDGQGGVPVGGQIRLPIELNRRRRIHEAGPIRGRQRGLHLLERQDLVAQQQAYLVAQVGAQHLRTIGRKRERDTVFDEAAEDVAHLRQ